MLRVRTNRPGAVSENPAFAGLSRMGVWSAGLHGNPRYHLTSAPRDGGRARRL